MSEHKDEKWLDTQLQRVVDGTTPTFDAEAWKQKYAREFEALLGRTGQLPGTKAQPSPRPLALRLPPILTHPLGGLIGKLAIAAVIVAIVGIFLIGRFGPAPDGSTPGLQSIVSQSPAQMVSMISLSAAFRQGGMEGLNEQCDRALERLGPRPNSVSMQELLKDINGKG